jgi:hypothetical protein
MERADPDMDDARRYALSVIGGDCDSRREAGQPGGIETLHR